MDSRGRLFHIFPIQGIQLVDGAQGAPYTSTGGTPVPAQAFACGSRKMVGSAYPAFSKQK